MFKQAETFFSAAMAVLMYSCSASAAIFEMQHTSLGASTPASLHPLGSGMKDPYQTVSIDQAGKLLFPSLKAGIARSEDLLWVAIGEAGLFRLQASPPNGDAALYLFKAERVLVQNTGHGAARHAPKESTAPEIWAVILIGAGLIWSQLRRKTRHSAIWFTAP
jgi:hypothetical protein